LSNPNIRETAKENPTMFFDINTPPIILDEIQKAGEIFDYIKDIVDESDEKGQYFLTGSQNFTLMQNASESLAGRAGIIQLLGLSQREIAGSNYYDPFFPTKDHIFKVSKQPSKDLIETIAAVHRGGFPELNSCKPTTMDWQDFFGSYFQSYIEKDIRDILNIKDEAAFIKFVRATASLSGQMLNYATLSELCEKDAKTVKSWLSVLITSGLVYILEPYYNNYNKRLIKMPKIYFLDTGLACWLLGYNSPEQMHNGAAWGHIFESFVVGEIIKSYYNYGITRPPIYYYRDKDKNEIDLLIENGDTLHPIEIKTTSDPKPTAAKAFALLKKNKAKTIGEGAIICLAKTARPLAENIWALPVWKI
jgi:predicted AAA+ superfamily ATPase